MSKLRVCKVTDQQDIDLLMSELDAPPMLAGNTFDGVWVNADQWREWKTAHPTSGAAQ